MKSTILMKQALLQNDHITCIVKVTNACNLNCPYCYNKINSENHEILPISTLEKVLENIVNNYKHGEIIFHGGEPFLAGYDWYVKAFDLINQYIFKYNIRLKIGIQTNGTLLNDEIIKLFKINGANIGLSFDGLTNELTRKNTKKLLSNMNLLKSYDMNVGSIMVITKDNCDNIIENYEYFNALDIDPTFNVIHNTSMMENNLFEDLKTEKLIDGMCKFFNYYAVNTSNKYNMSFIDKMVANVVNSENYLRNNKQCDIWICNYRWICISPNGDLYPCGKHWNKNYNIGNINNMSFKEAFGSENYKNYTNNILEKMNYCENNCRYFKYCMSGCPNDTLSNTGSEKMIDNSYCQLFDKLYTHIYNYIIINKYPIKRQNLLKIISEGSCCR